MKSGLSEKIRLNRSVYDLSEALQVQRTLPSFMKSQNLFQDKAQGRSQIETRTKTSSSQNLEKAIIDRSELAITDRTCCGILN